MLSFNEYEEQGGRVTFIYDTKMVYVSFLYVKPEYRRLGVGTSLIRKVKDFANRKVLPIYLRSVPGWNDLSQEDLDSFYEKNGFVREPRMGDFRFKYVPPHAERLDEVICETRVKGMLQSIATND